MRPRVPRAGWVVVAVIVLAIAAAGCERVPLTESGSSRSGASGAASSETTTAALGTAKRMDARIRMAVGSLKMSSATSGTAAFDARFASESDSWRPQVAYRVSTEGTPTAHLSVDQPEDVGPIPLGKVRNEWEVALARGVPTDLSLKLGVGEARIDLRDVDVRSIEAVTGVGETVIDLSGPRANAVSGTITCGVGDLTIRLPRDVGVEITGSGDGLGDVSSKGFTRTGNVLANGASSGTGPRIVLKIVRGVGEVKLELVE